jgi:hypothetical protein
VLIGIVVPTNDVRWPSILAANLQNQARSLRPPGLVPAYHHPVPGDCMHVATSNSVVVGSDVFRMTVGPSWLQESKVPRRVGVPEHTVGRLQRGPRPSRTPIRRTSRPRTGNPRPRGRTRQPVIVIDASVLSNVVGDDAADGHAARAALRHDVDLAIIRYPTLALMDRAYELRANVTPYGAAYVALAEALECPLLAGDRRLASTPGPPLRVPARRHPLICLRTSCPSPRTWRAREQQLAGRGEHRTTRRNPTLILPAS